MRQSLGKKCVSRYASLSVLVPAGPAIAVFSGYRTFNQIEFKIQNELKQHVFYLHVHVHAGQKNLYG